MSYFPIFIDTASKPILIVGGGKIANDKLIHLLDFTTNITIISPDILPSMQQLINKYNLNYKKRPYQISDIKQFNIVIVAVNSIKLQEQIYLEAKQLPFCLVNSVDGAKYCDFLFPSYIKKGDLTIAISTNGTSPSLARHIRLYLEKIIPNSVEAFLQQMKNYRQTMPKGKQRMQFLKQKAKEFVKSNLVLPS